MLSYIISEFNNSIQLPIATTGIFNGNIVSKLTELISNDVSYLTNLTKLSYSLV